MFSVRFPSEREQNDEVAAAAAFMIAKRERKDRRRRDEVEGASDRRFPQESRDGKDGSPRFVRQIKTRRIA